MFHRILVPLDGSEQAQHAIPVAARLARASGGSILLLQAISLTPGLAWSALEPPTLVQATIDADRARAAEYLARIAASRDLTGIEITTEVITATAAPAILSTVHSQHMDTIVMGSHGKTGFKRWALGSVAQKVARHSPVPVLVLNERGGAPTSLYPGGIHPVRVLVALDGSTLAETALAPAAYLCAALSAPAQGVLHLARVIHPPLIYEYGIYNDLAQIEQLEMLEANAYMRTVEQRIHESKLANLHLRVTASITTNLDVATTLIEMAETGKHISEKGEFPSFYVIVMATHGRRGL